ncbi:hypothetical protein C2845_PM15G06910 [Panicum miliaceum]|uniref:Uncharacterized protein n=1 Tax=Panicum miliaceum TaxID=4540 RepID=A0A3L6Q595_PANMI|nr:hypothetical protein C2845_PM15G06910 [Panicum miliaceum]
MALMVGLHGSSIKVVYIILFLFADEKSTSLLSMKTAADACVEFDPKRSK